MEQAVKHCTQGIGIWEWASQRPGRRSRMSSWPAAAIRPRSRRSPLSRILRRELPELKIRVVNVVDLMKLQPHTEHPHGLTDAEYDTPLHQG